MLPQAAQNKILPFIPTAVYNYKARVFYNTLQQTTDNTTQNKTTQLTTKYIWNTTSFNFKDLHSNAT